jgi:hypothetical protein
VDWELHKNLWFKELDSLDSEVRAEIMAFPESEAAMLLDAKIRAKVQELTKTPEISENTQ